MYSKSTAPQQVMGINYGHSRGLLIGNPETTQHFTFLDTRFRGYDEPGKRGINPGDKI